MLRVRQRTFQVPKLIVNHDLFLSVENSKVRPVKYMVRVKKNDSPGQGNIKNKIQCICT